jgi:MerR family transcriptional regulator/heat shock protein HspR
VGQASRGVSGADDVEKTRKPRGSLQFMAIEHHLYFISMAARLLDMHPQTLRKYERLGLVSPTRTVGSMRVYSQEELERLRLIKRLVEEEGVNLAGVQRLLSIAESVQRLRPMMQEGSNRGDVKKRIAQEIDRIGRTVGI